MQYNIGAIFRGCVLTAIIFSASLKKTLLPHFVRPDRKTEEIDLSSLAVPHKRTPGTGPRTVSAVCMGRDWTLEK
jgi:hypothetical protein